MRQYILVFVNGQQYRVTGADAFLTLSDFLRRRLGLCGTKIVCSEGDCGSCSVLCGRPDAPGENREAFQYVVIDSCIRFMFQLDGCHIVTVEGLARDGTLNGVQQAMIDCHGSQCGFCTPGFVIAMTGLLEEKNEITESGWREGLTGNLCRCTGYTPIIQAGLKSNPFNTPCMNECYSSPSMIETIQSCQDDEIRIEFRDHQESLQTVYCPKTVQQVVEFLNEQPQAKVVAGATDIGVQFNKGVCQSQTWLDLNRVDELEGVAINGDKMVVGARATWTEIKDISRETVPRFHDILAVFGSPQIRHVGTIGGNIINASPIADSIPFLLVCEAELELTSQSGVRTVNINDFYLGYKQMDLQPGELLTRIVIPLPAKHRQLGLYRVARRRDLDISSFTAAISIECDGDTITDAAIACGAVGPVVLRLRKTETFLCGRPLNLETMQLAGDVAVQEITPITDVRGAAEYRFQLTRNVLLKFLHETQPQGALV
ncbi:MAG: xanthine dehydrogenase small subunit [Pirellulaceae bacterium]